MERNIFAIEFYKMISIHKRISIQVFIELLISYTQLEILWLFFQIFAKKYLFPSVNPILFCVLVILECKCHVKIAIPWHWFESSKLYFFMLTTGYILRL